MQVSASIVWPTHPPVKSSTVVSSQRKAQGFGKLSPVISQQERTRGAVRALDGTAEAGLRRELTDHLGYAS